MSSVDYQIAKQALKEAEIQYERAKADLLERNPSPTGEDLAAALDRIAEAMHCCRQCVDNIGRFLVVKPLA